MEERPPVNPADQAPGPGAHAGEPPPIPVGEYAAGLVGEMRGMPRVTITGELVDVGRSRVQHYFQLRDERGGVPCAMWKNDFDRLGLGPEALREGAMVIARGGPDYYVGGRSASPAFSFRVTALRPAGEGDLLARLAALRARFEKEGLFEPQKLLEQPVLPRRIGVITAERGAARRDLLVGLERRGWQGEIVWGFAPVQDRNAAPAMTRALSDMAALGGVEVIVVCRGGGSLTDLWAFCDEDLCRTVAMLAVPVVSAVGHERDFTLIDDVAAVRCSTPTHAAEAAVPLDCRPARTALSQASCDVSGHARTAIRGRVGPLAAMAAAPARATRAQRAVLDQKAREVRASSERGLATRRERLRTGLMRGLVPGLARTRRISVDAVRRTGDSADAIEQQARESIGRRREAEMRRRVTLRAHDPQTTLERGYARIEDDSGHAIVSRSSAREAGRIKVVFSDGRIDAVVDQRSAPAGTEAKAGPRATRPRQAPEFEQTKLEGTDLDE
ncbi:MAG: exodeoxyribonuclease VII large subunit [Solirubrobacterales bacterium]|nr:exodeoxyribonuclease VII large subunit [Solirubrobacterales bacterium]